MERFKICLCDTGERVQYIVWLSRCISNDLRTGECAVGKRVEVGRQPLKELAFVESLRDCFKGDTRAFREAIACDRTERVV
jgi:hypothetical protein